MVRIWIAARHEAYGDYRSTDTIGAFSTPEKAVAACVQYADGDTLNFTDRLPGYGYPRWLVSDDWDNPNDPSSEYHFEINAMTLDHNPLDPEPEPAAPSGARRV